MFDEMAAIASAVLFSKLFVTVSHPRRRHLDGHEARMRGVHQRESDVVLAKHVGIRALPAAREQVECGSAAELDAALAFHRADPVQLPARAEDALLDSAAERERPELEHVARGVRLRARVEEQTPSVPRRRARPASAALSP